MAEPWEIAAEEEQDEPWKIAAEEERGLNARGAAGSVVEGLTLGWGDELLAGMMSPLAAYQADTTIPEAYRGLKEQINAPTRRFAEENPGSALTANIGGALMTGGFGLPRAASAVMPRATAAFGRQTVPAKAVIGGSVGGGVGAAGMAEDDIPTETGIGALTGGILGPVVPAVAGKTAEYAGKLASPIVERFRSPGSVAMRKARQAFDREDLPLDEAKARIEAMGPRATITDIGESPAMLGQGLAATPGPHQKSMRAQRDQRQLTQQPTILKELEQTTGQKGDYHSNMKAMLAQRQQEAAPLYDVAYKVDIPVNKDLASLFKRDQMRNAYNVARGQANIKGVFLPPMLDDAGNLTSDTMTTEMADWTKRGLDRLIEKETDDVTGKVSSTGRLLLGLKKEYLDIVDDSNPAFAQARQIFSDHSGMVDAAKAGRKALREDYEITEQLVSSMTKGEKDAFRNGMVREIIDRIESAVETGNAAARANLVTPKVRKRLRMTWPEGKEGDQQFEKFFKTLKREAKFSEQRAKEFLNSQTEMRRAAREDLAMPPTDGFPDMPESGAVGWLREGMRNFQTPAISDEAKLRLGNILSTEGVGANTSLLDQIYGYRPPGLIPDTPFTSLPPWAFAVGAGTGPRVNEMLEGK